MVNQVGKFTPVNLLAGDAYRATKPVILSKGQIYLVGSVLSMTQSGVCVLVDSKTENKEIFGVLAEEVDATETDQSSIAYITGEFNQSALVFGGTDTYSTHEKSARALGIIFSECSQS